MRHVPGFDIRTEALVGANSGAIVVSAPSTRLDDQLIKFDTIGWCFVVVGLRCAPRAKCVSQLAGVPHPSASRSRVADGSRTGRRAVAR
jgi:hypothetical protein